MYYNYTSARPSISMNRANRAGCRTASRVLPQCSSEPKRLVTQAEVLQAKIRYAYRSSPNQNSLPMPKFPEPKFVTKAEVPRTEIRYPCRSSPNRNSLPMQGSSGRAPPRPSAPNARARAAPERAREPVSGVWCLAAERAQLHVARRVRERLDAGVQISQRHVARSPVFQLRRAQRAV